MNSSDLSNPFVGLRPFESDESLLFFGRQEQTMQLLQRLHQHHFVAVVGSSGSGKSSLIRAGLIPSLKAGYLVDDRDKWLIAIMKPGQSPLHNLADSLLNELGPGYSHASASGLENKMKEEGADAILGILKHLWERDNTNFFLLIDQFEELFRFSMDQKDVAKKDEAIDFVNIILELSQQQDLPIYIVITMRSDFIGDCSQFYGLPEAMNQSQYLVPKLNRVQVKNAIEGPVKLYGAHINPALTSRLLNDVVSVKDELPLLQHALMRIWDHEMNEDKNGELDLNDYESIGGIEKALSNHADEALEGMSENELSLTKKMFQALTAIDENGRKIRRPVRLKELQEITGADKKQLLAIINRFIENKRSFLMISKAGVEDDLLIDISHESLIRQWGTLNGWVDEEADASKNYLRLVEYANLYRAGQRNYMTGIELQLALQWYEKFKPVPVWAKRYHSEFEETKQYLTQSESDWRIAEKKKKSDKKKRVLLIIGGIAAVIIALALNNINQTRLKNNANIAKEEALIAKRNAEENDSLAQVATSEALQNLRNAEVSDSLAQSEKRKAENERTRAFILADTAAAAALRAAEAQAKTETQKEAFRLITQARQTAVENPTFALRIAEAALRKDSDPLIFQEAQQIYRQNIFYKTIVRDDDPLTAMAISGTEILTGSDDGMISLRKKNGELLWKFKGHSDAIRSVAFSPDGTKIITGSEDETAMLWNKNGDSLASLKGHKGEIFCVAFSPDGKEILTGSVDDTTRLWTINGELIRKFEAQNDPIISLAFSPDGTKILTGSASGKVRLWNKNGDSSKLIQNKRGSGDIITSVAFSPDGTKILSGSEDNTATLWSIEGDSITQFEGHTDDIYKVAFSPDGRKILTCSSDGTARLWSLEEIQSMELKGHTDEIYSGAFSKDGTEIFTCSSDGTIKVWNIEPFQFKEIKEEGSVMSAIFSPDGKKILVGCASGVAGLWTLDNMKRKELPAHSDYILAVAFSKEGTKIITASRDGRAVLWDSSGKELKRFGKHIGTCNKMSTTFSSEESKIFMVAMQYSKLRLLEFNIADATEKEFEDFTQKDLTTSAAFLPDGTKVLIGFKDSIARLWTINGRLLQKFRGHTGIINCVAFSPDGTKVLTGSSDKTAILWSLDGNMQKELKGNTRAITFVTFSQDGTKILTTSSNNNVNNTIRLWNSDGILLWEFKVDGDMRSIVLSPDGKKILTATGGAKFQLWNTPMPLANFLESDKIEKLTAQQKKDYGIIKR